MYLEILRRKKVHCIAHSRAVSFTDKPHQQSAAEWQDWPFASPKVGLLFVGYWYKQDGGMVSDPKLEVSFAHGILEDCVVTPSLGSRHVVTLQGRSDLLQGVRERHISYRA